MRSTKLKYFLSPGFKIYSTLICNWVTVRNAIKSWSITFLTIKTVLPTVPPPPQCCYDEENNMKVLFKLSNNPELCITKTKIDQSPNTMVYKF